MIERKFVKEGLVRSKLSEYLKRKLRKAGYVSVNIQKTPVMTRVVIRVERPGLVIGKKGATIRQLTKIIEEEFKMENVQIKVEEVPIPELSAAVMARRIAASLEKGVNFRRVILWSVEKIMKSGAKGAEIVVSGKLVGKGGKSRSERVSRGYMKKAGEHSKLVNTAQTQAIKKAGIIGVTVRIVPPHIVFPDKVDIKAATREAAEREEKKKAEEIKKIEGGETLGNNPKEEAVGNEPARAEGKPAEAKS